MAAAPLGGRLAHDRKKEGGREREGQGWIPPALEQKPQRGKSQQLFILFEHELMSLAFGRLFRSTEPMATNGWLRFAQIGMPIRDLFQQGDAAIRW